MSNHAIAIEHPADRLLAAADGLGAPVCVGIDPVFERLPKTGRDADDPSRSLRDFSLHVLDALTGVVPAVKIQSACFERYGSAGVAACERVVNAARERRFVVILDAKRGDIGVSAEHYAAAALDGPYGGHWVTINPYFGRDGIDPFLELGGAFALVRTSNPGGDAMQSPRLGNGDTVAEHVARQIAELGRNAIGDAGYSRLGAVVGATKPDDALRLRACMPEQIFLLPGIGAQGGTIEALREVWDERGHGAIVTASRSIIYAFTEGDGDWSSCIGEAGRRFADDVGRLLGLR